ncbi:HAMP domain-containing protein [Sphingomonas hankookensis]|uniref:HAMP domain-containing protein n=1 Tax=Sphingomonas hankookensis TaxID=563996 RepID=UPI001F580782|nr:methyl-accepting chemotaxis protein [Sphingomonas hankookensis]
MQALTGSMTAIYDDRIVPLKQLKQVSDAYGLNVVDTTHQLRAHKLDWQQASARIDSAIRRNLRDATDLVASVARGDVSTTVEARSNDEVGTLIDALNAMVVRLRGVIGEANAAAENVAAGSQQLSASSEQVSQGATEQAAST